MDNKVPWTTDKMRENANNWTLECDGYLLEVMQNFAKNLETKTLETSSNLSALTAKLNRTSIALENTTNKLTALQHSQFVENRVYDDDETLANINEVPVTSSDDSHYNPIETLNTILKNNLVMLNNCHEKVCLDLDDSDDEEETPKSILYRSKNPYDERPLPHIFGSRDWNEKWHIGLYDSDDDYSGDDKEEEYSDSSESYNSLPSIAPTVSESEGSVWGLRVNSALPNNRNLNLNDDDNHSNTLVSKTPVVPKIPDDRYYVHKSKIPNLFDESSSEEDMFSDNINIPRQPASNTISNIINDEPPELDVVDRRQEETPQKSALFYESEEEHNQENISINTSLRKKPVNLFDDDDFDSFMFELGKKTKERNTPQNETVQSVKQIIETKSSINSNDQAIRPVINELKKKMDKHFEEKDSGNEKKISSISATPKPVTTEPVVPKTATKTDLSIPDKLLQNTQSLSSSSGINELKNKVKNLFDDDFSDEEETVPTSSSNVPAKQFINAPIMDDLFATTSKSESSNTFLKKTTNLFDDIEDDFDSLFNTKTSVSAKNSGATKTEINAEVKDDVEKVEYLSSEGTSTNLFEEHVTKNSILKKNLFFMNEPPEDDDFFFSSLKQKNNEIDKTEEQINSNETMTPSRPNNDEPVEQEYNTIADIEADSKIPITNSIQSYSQSKSKTKNLFDEFSHTEENTEPAFVESCNESIESGSKNSILNLIQSEDDFNPNKNTDGNHTLIPNLFNDDEIGQQSKNEKDMLFSKNEKKENHNNVKFDDEIEIQKDVVTENAVEKIPKEQNSGINVNLFSDEPPNDDWIDQEFENIPQPEIPSLNTLELPEDLNSNVMKFNPIGIVQDIPPPDEIDDETNSFIPKDTTKRNNVYYDDFAETIVSVQSPPNYIYSEEPPPDDECEIDHVINSSMSIDLITKIDSEKSIKEDSVGLETHVSETDQSVANLIKKVSSPKEHITVESSNQPVNKLNKTNFNINVKALMPGAKRPSVVKTDTSVNLKSESSTNILIIHGDILQAESHDSTMITSTLSNLNKGRVKIAVKRRPSTRRGRQENYRKGLIHNDDFESSANDDQPVHDNANVVSENITTNIKIPQTDNMVVETKSTTTAIVPDIDSTINPNRIIIPQNRSVHDTSVSNVRATTSIPSTCRKQSHTNAIKIVEPIVENLAKLLEPTKSYIFEDSDSDDLFGSKKASIKSKPFPKTSVSKSTSKPSDKKTIPTKSKGLFSSDEDEDDDLFGSSVTKTLNIIQSSTEKKLLPAKSSGGLFADTDDDDDDLFGASITRPAITGVSSGSKRNEKKNISKPSSKAEANDNPLADLL